jgi:hypothetical protein
MNNLLSYCGLVDAKIRASDKYLPVFDTYWIITRQTSDFLIVILVIVIHTVEDFCAHLLFQELLQKADG